MRIRGKLSCFTLLFISLLMFLGPLSCYTQHPGQTRITIFHINDMHAKIDNLAKVAWLIKEEKKKNPNTFFVSAGDNFSGNPVVDQYEPKGEPVRWLYSAIGLDVLALGNHEFDYGQESLKRFMTDTPFRVICANLETSGQAVIPQPAPYTIVETADKVKLAFLGLVQVEPDTGQPGTHPARLGGLTFHDPLQIAAKYSSLRDQCQVVIALTHLGYETDRKLAGKTGFLDIIIGGHTHTVIKNPAPVNGVLIAQAGSQARYLGRIDITLTDGKITGKRGLLVDLSTIAGEDADIKKKIAAFNDNPYLEKKVTTLAQPLKGQAIIGHLVVDAMRSVHRLDIALHNQGGIRADRLAKEVKLKAIYTILPFGDYAVQFNLSPEEIRSLLQNTFERMGRLDLYVSGITYTISYAAGSKVTGIELRDLSGRPLDESRTFRVGMNDYMASSDTYAFTHKDPGKSLDATVAATLVQYLQVGQDVMRDLDRPRMQTRLVPGKKK